MTVAELIAILDAFDDDTEVVMRDNEYSESSWAGYSKIRGVSLRIIPPPKARNAIVLDSDE